MDAKKGPRASWAWHSILAGRNVLEKGLCWSVGDGISINFWRDPWIPDLPNFKLSSDAPLEAWEDARVGEFIFNNSWELSAISHWISGTELNAIKNVQFPCRSRPDELKWCFNVDGEYSVKSGYVIAKKDCGVEDVNLPSTSFSVPPSLWKAIWNLKTPNKVKHFLWRACVNALPTKEQLWKRKCSPTPICMCCSSFCESVEHMLLCCEWVESIWFCCPLSLRIDENSILRFDIWLHKFLTCPDLSDSDMA